MQLRLSLKAENDLRLKMILLSSYVTLEVVILEVVTLEVTHATGLSLEAENDL